MRVRTLATRTLGLTTLLAATLGTTCATIMRAHAALKPFPPLACLRAALATSPDVVEVTREFDRDRYGDEGFWVVLRDSTAKDGRRLASLLRETPNRRERPEDRGARLEFSVGWPGFKRPPAVEERAAKAIAARLLTHLQTRCAPDMPPAPAVCDRGDGEWKSCVPGG